MIKYIVSLFLITFSVTVIAQTTNSSPYSFYGIGDNASSKTVREMSMGGIGVANTEWNAVNFSNPAAASNIRLTNFSVAGLSNFLTLKDNNAKEKTSSTSLGYVSLAFPITKRSGLVLGVQPNTTVGYNLTTKENDLTGNLLSTDYYNGSGGTNRMFFSFGHSLFKNKLSIGFGGDYFFGNYDNSVVNQRENVFLATKYATKTEVKGGTVQFGMQFKDSISSKLILNLGASIRLKHDLNAKGNQYLYSTVYVNGAESPRDTIVNTALEGVYSNPAQFNFGAGIGQPFKWYAGVNYTFQKATSYNGDNVSNNNDINFEDSSRLSLGGYYIPKMNSISNYWDRVSYRAGVRFEKTGLQVNTSDVGTNFESVDDFGMSFGVGLPVGKKFSKLDLGFEFGKRGTSNSGLIEENYFNLRIGLSFSDKWFNKRKID